MSGLPITTINGFVYGTVITSGLEIGMYIGIFRYHVNPSSGTAKVQVSTNTGNGISIYGYNDTSYNAAGTGADGFDNNLTIMISVFNATTSSITFQMYSAVQSSSMTNAEFRIMRIA